MVVGNGGGFTAVEFNGSTQTVLSPEHHRDYTSYSEQILGVQRSASYETNRLLRVYFSVYNYRNPIGNTSIYLQTNSDGGYPTVTSVVQADSDGDLYYAIVNTGILTVNNIQLIKVLDSSNNQIYSQATNVTLGADY